MIRVIRIGDQITDEADDSALYDTVVDAFIGIDGYYVWGALDDLERSLRHDPDQEWRAERILSLARAMNPPFRVTAPPAED